MDSNGKEEKGLFTNSYRRNLFNNKQRDLQYFIVFILAIIFIFLKAYFQVLLPSIILILLKFYCLNNMNLNLIIVFSISSYLILKNCKERTNEICMTGITKGNKKTSGPYDIWYIDSGATVHMTGNHNDFIPGTYRLASLGRVTYGDGNSGKIIGQGSVLCPNGIILTEVRHVQCRD